MRFFKWLFGIQGPGGLVPKSKNAEEIAIHPDQTEGEHICYPILENEDNGDPETAIDAAECRRNGWRTIDGYILAPGELPPTIGNR